MTKRIITAFALIFALIIILGLGTLYTVFYKSTSLYGLALFGAISFFIIALLTNFLAINEYLNLLKLDKNKLMIYALVFVSTFYFLLAPFFPSFTFVSYTTNYNALILRPIDLLLLIFVWLFLSLFIPNFSFSKTIFVIFGILFLGYFFRSVVFLVLQPNLGWSVLWFIFAITGATDAFSFWMGKWVGKIKIAPNISPNKTVEGSLYGLLFGVFNGTFFACIFTYLMNIHTLVFGSQITDFYLRTNFFLYALVFLAMSLLISICAQLGDLVFSKIKRDHNVKDFSNIFPGHGGVLDRIDSFIVASGVYCIIYVIFIFSN